MSDVISDLQYRVVQIQVFVGEGRVKGWRFLFRHWVTQHQEFVPDRVAIEGPSSREVIDLHDHEFLVDATFVTTTTAIKDKHVGAVTGVEFITSARRNVRVGTGFSEPTTFPSEAITKEVRAIRPILIAHRQAIGDATPSFHSLPARAELDAARLRIINAASNKCHHEEACTRLEATAATAGTALADALARGIVVPVAAIIAFLELTPKGAAVLTSCGRSAVTWRGKREPALVEYTAEMAAIRDAALTRVPHTERQTLERGDAITVQTSASVPCMVRNAIASSQPAIAAELFVKYIHHTPSDDASLVHEVVEALLPVNKEVYEEEDLSNFALVRKVVDAYTRWSDTPSTKVLDPYRAHQARLCELAVRARDAVLLHWLIVKALMDPFHVHPNRLSRQAAASDCEAIVAVSTRATDQARHRRDAYERLILMIHNGAVDDAQAEMTELLTSLMDREEFQRGMLAIAISDTAVSIDDIMALVPKITSVYDLAYLAPVASKTLSSSEMTRLFDAYCHVVVAKRLVQVDDDCAFFNIALRHARKRGFVDEFGAERRLIQARHVNAEAAAYIVELKLAMRLLHARLGCLELQVHALRQSLAQLSNALHLQEVAELRRRRVRHAVALVASILYAVGGHVIQAGHDMFESWNVTAMFGHGIAALEIDATAVVNEDVVRESLVDHSVRLVLANANINEDEFVAQLHAAVLAIHEARLTAAAPSPLTASPSDQVAPSPGRARRVVISTSSVERSDVRSYHAAVLVSGGDLDRFKQLETNLVANKADINARVTILVEKRKTRSNATTKTRTSTKSVPAHVYASHLGYRSIVDHLLANPSLRKRREFAFVTKWRARRVAKMEVDAAVGAPAA